MTADAWRAGLNPAVPPLGPSPHPLGPVVGIVLAAGRGRRAGGAKALKRGADGTSWLADTVQRLYEGGCTYVVVVLGSRSRRARALVPPKAIAVVAAGWRRGMSESLRTGLARADATLGTAPVAVAVTPVDIPDGSPATLHRLLTHVAPDCLVRATFEGRPGHPVLIGRDHWRPLARTLTGDRGAAEYLADHGALEVECGDLETGQDVDT